MKTKKKALLLSFCAVLLVVASVLGTMAFLTSQDQVLNTFTVGNVKINLDEADVTPDGVTVPTASRVHENDYKLMPGHTYTKDPTVTVLAGSEESFIKMEVTVNKHELLWHSGLDVRNCFQGYSSDWIYITDKADRTNDTRTYVFYYKDTVSALDGNVVLPALFTEVVVPDTLTNETIKLLDGLNISVKAYAIQADGFKSSDTYADQDAYIADANTAWANFA